MRWIRAPSLFLTSDSDYLSSTLAADATLAFGSEPSKKRGTLLTSCVVKQTLDPLWEQTFAVDGEFEELCRGPLTVSVFDDDSEERRTVGTSCALNALATMPPLLLLRPLHTWLIGSHRVIVSSLT